MARKSKRKHTRVSLDAKADLRFANDETHRCIVKNLCLSGMWVISDREHQVGEECEIILHDVGITNNRILRLKGEVVRVEDAGTALLFTEMNLRSYTAMQTLILDNAEDPFGIAEEFLDTLPSDQ